MNLRLALAQINATVGDFSGNRAKILDYLERARALDTDVVAFPELILCGYPPEDLVFRKSFLRANQKTLKQIIPQVRDLVAIIGFVEEGADRASNAAAVVGDGQLLGVYRKHCLPNYGVFDELRYFTPGEKSLLFTDGEVSFGVTICEDLWYPGGPLSAQARAGAQLIINISASPYEIQKGYQRETLLAARTTEGAALALCNLVGGQDELIFDGQNLIYDAHGKLLARAKAFAEDLLSADVALPTRTGRDAESVTVVKLSRPLVKSSLKRSQARRVEAPLSEPEEIYRALVLATRDYVRKNGFQQVLTGISGGVDSALVACIAADALGAENVTGLFLPARYTSEESREDAEQLAQHLKIKLLTLSIDSLYEASLQALAPLFLGLQADSTEENLQARLRALLWMALSNKFGALVLTAGSKSELAVGYATLYGDMAGGFAVLKDLTKTRVYQLAHWRNSQSMVIPERVLSKAPTAELRPQQTDEGDLPRPYKDLDRVIEAFVEQNASAEEIAQTTGLSLEIVGRIVRLIVQHEHKRRQAPVGPKITKRAFGRDWRQPISNRHSRT